MDKIRDISIVEAVVQVLNNDQNEPVLNNYKLDLNDERYKFILSHLEKVLKDEYLKYGKFKQKATDVKAISQEYLNGRVDIIKASQTIAKSLFSFMHDNNNIPSCDLLVVSLVSEVGPMLAILRFDFMKQFIHKIDVYENGIGIDITSVKDGLSATKKVPKAAFIKPIRKGDYELLVFDKSYVKDNDEYMSNYFVDKFLGCQLIESDRDKTRDFINAVEVWTRSNINEDAARSEKIRRMTRTELTEKDIIDVYEFAELINPYDVETRKKFIGYMQQWDLDKIPVDKDYVDKKLSKLKLKISSDIELSITEDAYKDINQFEIQDNGDGSIHMLIKNVANYVEK